ncbi:MAG: DegV family protein [Anaerolineales bacterium]
MSIAIVTDSTADIPPELAHTWQIHVVPTILIIQGQEYLDGEGLSRQDYYTRLPALNPPPTTATPAVGAFERLYRRLLEAGHEHIISIHLARSLSGVYQAASIAAQNIQQAAITLVDSGQITLGLGFQVLEAARSARQNLSAAAILARIHAMQPRIRVLAMLDTLEYLRRSGRVSWARAALGSLLNIKPFVALQNSVVLPAGQTRTRRKGLETLQSRLNTLGALEWLAVLHSNAEADARALLAACLQPVANPPLVINITPVLGTHVGPKGVGFAAVIAPPGTT